MQNAAPTASPLMSLILILLVAVSLCVVAFTQGAIMLVVFMHAIALVLCTSGQSSSSTPKLAIRY